MVRKRRSDPAASARRAQRREQLLDAALAVIRREGPGASMDTIAAEAGITKPILYRHFGDRGGLTAALADRFVADLLSRLAAALERPGHPREVLAGTIDAFLAFIEEDPELYRFLIQRGVQEHPHELYGFVRQVGTRVAVVLGERLRDAGVDSGAAEPWAHGMVGMVHQAADWWSERRSMPRERLAEYLVSLLWSGLAGAGLASATGSPAPPAPVLPLPATKEA